MCIRDRDRARAGTQKSSRGGRTAGEELVTAGCTGKMAARTKRIILTSTKDERPRPMTNRHKRHAERLNTSRDSARRRGSFPHLPSAPASAS
eukprot:1947867-Pleurochrysis_carterae.AAC.2